VIGTGNHEYRHRVPTKKKFPLFCPRCVPEGSVRANPSPFRPLSVEPTTGHPSRGGGGAAGAGSSPLSVVSSGGHPGSQSLSCDGSPPPPAPPGAHPRAKLGQTQTSPHTLPPPPRTHLLLPHRIPTGSLSGDGSDDQRGSTAAASATRAERTDQSSPSTRATPHRLPMTPLAAPVVLLLLGECARISRDHCRMATPAARARSPPPPSPPLLLLSARCLPTHPARGDRPPRGNAEPVQWEAIAGGNQLVADRVSSLLFFW
jgi:hypothetical protein